MALHATSIFRAEWRGISRVGVIISESRQLAWDSDDRNSLEVTQCRWLSDLETFDCDSTALSAQVLCQSEETGSDLETGRCAKLNDWRRPDAGRDPSGARPHRRSVSCRYGPRSPVMNGGVARWRR